MILYVVKNQDGQYFRAKGYGGYGKTWVDELEGAKFYTKIGPARAQQTWFSKHFPEFGVPDIISVAATEGTPLLEERDRVKKILAKELVALEKADLEVAMNEKFSKMNIEEKRRLLENE